MTEYLDSREGDRLPREPRGRSRRTLALIGGGVGVLALGGAAWAAWSFFSTGAQPAEALPAGTLAYASIDLDPSGGQKIEALQTLRKFPAFKDQVKIGARGDVRKWILDQISDHDACHTDYDRDVEPWLGNRFAVAAIDSGGDTPDPVFVVQVSDEGAAGKALRKMRNCYAGGAGAWALHDGWAVLGETQKIVDQVADDAAEKSLADDSDFRHWTDQAGDSGIVSMYAAPGAGKAIADGVGGLGDVGDLDQLGNVGRSVEALRSFRGGAATLRFDDGGLELEAVGDAGKRNRKVAAGDQAGAAVESLPKTTVAALSLSLGHGWAEELMKQLEATGVAGSVSEVSEQLGITLPDDAETLVGDAVTLALNEDFDPGALMYDPQSADPAGDLGAGVKVLGRPDDIEAVLGKLRTAAGGQDSVFLDSDSGKGVVALGPDGSYRKALVKEGGLGDSKTFGRVVEHPDGAGAVVYVDFDGGNDWLAELADDDADTRANIKPLDALDLSSWLEGDTTHVVLKVTTD